MPQHDVYSCFRVDPSNLKVVVGIKIYLEICMHFTLDQIAFRNRPGRQWIISKRTVGSVKDDSVFALYRLAVYETTLPTDNKADFKIFQRNSIFQTKGQSVRPTGAKCDPMSRQMQLTFGQCEVFGQWSPPTPLNLFPPSSAQSSLCTTFFFSKAQVLIANHWPYLILTIALPIKQTVN